MEESRKMLVTVTNIDWDMDGEEYPVDDLPATVELEVEDEDEIADRLSDRYGFCVRGFAVDER